MARKRKRKRTIASLKKLADKYFSIYIRKRDKGTCFTCFKKDEWKYMQCGHYIPRNFNSLRYDERNCHAQCPGCNIFKQGNKDVYALCLQGKYGFPILQKLAEDKKISKSFACEELEDIIEEYKKKGDTIC